jgi:hypothetical protein
MNLLNTKVVLSALGIVAVLASPAFAQKRQHVTHLNQSESSNGIPGYDRNGNTVTIPDPDHR